jgi:two-component system sensor histidine kinase AlgZ
LATAADTDDDDTQVYLPDFCAAGTILVVILVAELVAIVLTLAGQTTPGAFLTVLSKMSMYVLWLALLSAAILCRMRPWVEKFGKRWAFVISFALLLLLCLVMAELTFRVTLAFSASHLISDSHAVFLLRTFTISAIVIALGMRYLYISSEWRRSIVLEAQSRIKALQALIRPHFLFNSMNTIASLTRSNPSLAEEAVEDLADLLRANLTGPKTRTTLEEELEVAYTYERIEKLRLGDRLDVKWEISELPMRALIPSLTIQPLLENAIFHGIELLPDGGTVTVRGDRRDDSLRLEISNPVTPESKRKKDGNRMALSNISQRFELAYGNNSSVEVEETDQEYVVRLRFPFDETRT